MFRARKIVRKDQRRRPSEQRLSACWTAHKMERASRIMMFSSRKKPPYAANFHSDGSRRCKDTSGKSARLSFRARHLFLVRTGILQTGLRRDGAKRTRPGTDGPGAALEPCPFRDTAHLRSQLTTSFTNREREALFRCIGTNADIKPMQTPITVEETKNSPPKALCFKCTVDHDQSK